MLPNVSSIAASIWELIASTERYGVVANRLKRIFSYREACSFMSKSTTLE